MTVKFEENKGEREREEMEERDEKGNRHSSFSESENYHESGFQEAAFREKQRVVRSMRGIILESINILYRVYGVNSLFHFRQSIFRMETCEELEMAAKMLEVFSRFQIADPVEFDRTKAQQEEREGKDNR